MTRGLESLAFSESRESDGEGTGVSEGLLGALEPEAIRLAADSGGLESVVGLELLPCERGAPSFCRRFICVEKSNLRVAISGPADSVLPAPSVSSPKLLPIVASSSAIS